MISDEHDKQLGRIGQLRYQLEENRKKRSASVMRLKAAADEAAHDTPADSLIFYAEVEQAKRNRDVAASGVRELPQEERKKTREVQLQDSRALRRKGLADLKQTTVQAIKSIRPTELLDPKELQRRLAGGAGAAI